MKEQTYVFRIRTKNGELGNLRYRGTSQPDAEQKLRKIYPEAEILDVQVLT